MASERESLVAIRRRGFQRWAKSLVVCGPRWTLRHLKSARRVEVTGSLLPDADRRPS